MSKKRLGYSLIFVETIKECGRNNKFEPTKYKRIEITNECSEYLFNNNEARMEMFNQMFCYKDRIREMLEHSDYENVNDSYQQIAELQHQLDVAEKALELACSHIPCKNCPHSNGAEICYIAQDIGYYQPEKDCIADKGYYFKLKAESELKGE